MATIASISAYPSTPLSVLEVEKVREIVSGGRLYVATSAIAERVALLSPEARQATRADIDAWDAVGDGTEKIRPVSSDGLDYDAVRDREFIRRRLALRMGYRPEEIAGGLWGWAYRG